MTYRLDGLGPEVFGTDLSPLMVAPAQQTHPGPCFDRAWFELDVADGSLPGLVA